MYFVFLLTMKIEPLLPAMELIECLVQLSGHVAQVLRLSHVCLVHLPSLSALGTRGQKTPSRARILAWVGEGDWQNPEADDAFLLPLPEVCFWIC